MWNCFSFLRVFCGVSGFCTHGTGWRVAMCILSFVDCRMLCWFSTRVWRLSKAWLAFQILSLIFFSREPVRVRSIHPLVRLGSRGGQQERTIQQKSFSSLFCERSLWAILAWVGMLTLFIQHFLCPPSKMPRGIVLKRLSWRVTPERCEFPSLDRCQKRPLWTYKEVNLAPHPVVGLVMRLVQVWDVGNFPQALRLESLDPFLRVSKQGSCLTAIEEDGGWRRETCTSWTCLQSWCCCFARSCLIWPPVPLLRQSWCGFLLSRRRTFAQACSHVLGIGHLFHRLWQKPVNKQRPVNRGGHIRVKTNFTTEWLWWLLILRGEKKKKKKHESYRSRENSFWCKPLQNVRQIVWSMQALNNNKVDY